MPAERVVITVKTYPQLSTKYGETVHDELKPLVAAAHDNRCSLATFRPSEVLDFGWEPCEREWDSKKMEAMRNFEAQGQLFAGEDWREGFRVIPKLPYKFRYKFRDANGDESNPQVLDWEVGALFWKCLRSEATEGAALEKVREKFLSTLTKRDLHFFLGTTQNYHGWATNPWLIVGVFYPPVVNQQELGLGLG